MPRRKSGRRASGEGSVYPTADGSGWKVELWVTDPDGRRRRLVRRAPNQKSALATLTTLRVQAQTGQLAVTSAVTLASFLDTWLRDISAPSVTDTTHLRHQYEARRLVALLGGHRLRDLRPAHVQAAQTRLLAHYAPGTVLATMATLRQALRLAVRWKLITENPADGIKSPRNPRTPRATLSRDEGVRLARGRPGDPYTPLWLVLLTTGLRLGEALGLRWDDIDAERGRLTVRMQLTRRPAGGLALTPRTKTVSSARTLALLPIVLAALSSHHERQQAEGIPPWQGHDLVFRNQRGGPLHPQTARGAFRRTLTALDVTRIVPHGARHTLATLSLEDGIPLKLVSEILGHASTRTTADIYAHVTPHAQRDALERYGRLLTEPSEAQLPPADPPARASSENVRR